MYMNANAAGQWIINAVGWLFELATFLIVVRVFVSWVFPYNSGNAFVRFIYRTTEPILAPIRQFLGDLFHFTLPIDLSPIVAIVLLLALRRLCITVVHQLLF